MRILILGPGKSGTTALTYLFKANTENHDIIFEPKDLNEINFEQENNVIVKSVRINKWPSSKPVFPKFDLKVVLIRHPFDRLISYFLYIPFRGLGFSSDSNSIDYLNLIAEKTKNPNSVSIEKILNKLNSIAGYDLILEFVKEYRSLLALYNSNFKDFFFFKYEDLVDEKYQSLEDFCGFNLSKQFEVADSYKRVIRTKSHSGWKNWFSDSDINYLSDFFSDYLSKFDYDSNFVADKISILPENSFDYTKKIINEYRRKYFLPELMHIPVVLTPLIRMFDPPCG